METYPTGGNFHGAYVQTLGPWQQVPDLAEIGRGAWTLMHTMAVTYPNPADETHSTAWKQFMRSQQHLFPCVKCRAHIAAYLRAHPFPRGVLSRKYIQAYLFKMHNAVNRRLGKPMFTREAYAQRWGRAL